MLHYYKQGVLITGNRHLPNRRRTEVETGNLLPPALIARTVEDHGPRLMFGDALTQVFGPSWGDVARVRGAIAQVRQR